MELGFRRDLFISVPSFHPTFRLAPDGSLRMKMVVEMAQTAEVPFDPRRPELGTFPMRGGATLLIEKIPWSPNLAPRICYLIQKRLDHEDGQAREVRQRQYGIREGLVEGNDPRRFQLDFNLLHGGLL